MRKNSSRTKSSLKNIVFGLIMKLIGLFFPFIIKTIIIWTLGKEYLGLNSLFSSILSVLSLSELGVGSALIFSMYKPIAENNKKKICALLNEYKKIYRIIGIVILILGIMLLPFISIFINGECPNQINIYILYLMYLADTIISYFMYSYKYALLEAHQKNSIESIIQSIVKIIMYVSQILILVKTKNYYIYLVLMPICTILLNLLRNKIVNKMYPEYICDGNINQKERKEIFSKIKALIGHKIGTTVITSADSIVISTFIGLEGLAIYSNYYMIINTLIGLITVFYNSIMASIGNIIATEELSEKYKKFELLNFINNWIVSFCTICLICLYQPFMKLWMGKDMLFPFHMVILFAIYLYSWLIRRIGLTYKDAAGMWKEDFWKPYVGIIINLVTNILLVKTIGIEGVIISTIIVMVAIYLPWETNVVFKNIFKRSPKKYLKNIFIDFIITTLAAIITYSICSLVTLKSIIGLIIKAIICTLISNVIFYTIYRNKKEFIDLKNKYLKEIINKTRGVTHER